MMQRDIHMHVHLLYTLHFPPYIQQFAQIFVYWAEFPALKGQSGYSCQKILIAHYCMLHLQKPLHVSLSSSSVSLRFSCISSNVALTRCLSPNLFPTSSQSRITKCFDCSLVLLVHIWSEFAGDHLPRP